MSLVSTFGSLLSWAIAAFVVGWFSALKGWVPVNQRGVWRDLTAPIRTVHRVLTPIVFLVTWIGLWFVTAILDAYVALLLLTFAIPILLAWEYWPEVIGTAIGIPLGVIDGLTPTPEPDGDTFRLPFTVYESNADDVREWLSSAVPIPRRSLLTLGASGSGKSETLKHFVDQLQIDPTEPVVVFDMKTDYQDFLEKRGVPMVRVAASGSDVTWNVFRELEDESDADEIARALFPEQRRGDNFFSTAARQLFAANLKYLRRELESPSNADLVRYWERADSEKMYENLTRDGHEDLTAAASAIDPDAGRQASGVFATAQQQVSDIFVGDFAGEGDFSIREYMESPQGFVLVLDYPSRRAETVGPLYRFLLDDAIKHGMDDPGRQAYYLLDEIEHLSVALSRLGELINVGRGNQCQAIISLQSVAQLYDTYGEQRGQALLSGMATSIILRCGDSESVEYARATIGTHFEEYTAHTEKESIPGGGSITTARETRLEEQHDFAAGDFYGFDAGEAIVTRQGEGWVHGRVRMLED